MYRIFLYALLFTISFISAQEINQFDANHKRHGKWMKTYEGTKQIRYRGQFNHGKEIGVFEFFHKDPKGNHPSCIKKFEDNSEMANVAYYSSTGILLESGKMKGKKRVGIWKAYDRKTNLLQSEEPYKEGVLNGVSKFYYANRSILEEKPYKNGKIHGAHKIFSEDGILLSSTTYSNGELDGPFTLNNGEGKLKKSGKYKMGRPQGVWKFYENGKLVKEKDYTKSRNPFK